jgi:hypothetical protein
MRQHHQCITQGATMKTVIEMAREVCGVHTEWTGAPLERLTHFAELVRADEREQIIDLVAMYGGPVDLEAAIRARETRAYDRYEGGNT